MTAVTNQRPITAVNFHSNIYELESCLGLLPSQCSDGENRVRAAEDEVSSPPGAPSDPGAGLHPHLPGGAGETGRGTGVLLDRQTGQDLQQVLKGISRDRC